MIDNDSYWFGIFAGLLIFSGMMTLALFVGDVSWLVPFTTTLASFIGIIILIKKRSEKGELEK